MIWKKGDILEVTVVNPDGGATYGEPGDIVEVVEGNSPRSKNMRVKFVDKNREGKCTYDFWLLSIYVKEIITEYELDQKLDEGEDLL